MLPTPSTSHVAFERIYEPAEDSFLLLDTLSSESEKDFLRQTFSSVGPREDEQENKNNRNNHGNDSSSATQPLSPSPLVVEIGTGSGVVISFINAHAEVLFGRADILTAGVDINHYACEATRETVQIAAREQQTGHGKQVHGIYLGSIVGDLLTPLRAGIVDVLVFNPPYVPTEDLPSPPPVALESNLVPSFEDDSHLLSLSYAGGVDGMETTDRLLDSLPMILNKDRGCAYILLCAQNKPETVKQRIRNWGREWQVEMVGSSGKKAGWEKLQIIRIWRNTV
ncbi:hypothetical protein B7463_g4340, partial [Scytalidium lignicola]